MKMLHSKQISNEDVSYQAEQLNEDISQQAEQLNEDASQQKSREASRESSR